MSGPKTSHYTLTAEQRRILEEQRKVKTECDMLSKQLGDARSVISEADRLFEKMDPFFAECEAETTMLSQAKKLRTEAAHLLPLASSASDKDGYNQLKQLNKELSSAIRKLTIASKLAEAEYYAAEKSFRADLAAQIDDGFDISFDTIGDTSAIKSHPLTRKIRSELESLISLPLTTEQKAKLNAIQVQLEGIEDPYFLKNFHAMTVTPFAKECRTYHAAYAVQGEEYERKCLIYYTNAQKLGVKAEIIPFSVDSITILDARIKETEEAIRQQDEQAYISKCVDEAMREMGYPVIGSRDIVRRNGQRFRNALYMFDEGTAVNVTYSDNGQITMELGGIGIDDHLPTIEESESLVSDMCAFCDDYRELEKRLQNKGIVTNKISILPPDAQYAQIINISDYNMDIEVSEYKSTGVKKYTAIPNTQRVGE